MKKLFCICIGLFLLSICACLLTSLFGSGSFEEGTTYQVRSDAKIYTSPCDLSFNNVAGKLKEGEIITIAKDSEGKTFWNCGLPGEGMVCAWVEGVKRYVCPKCLKRK